MTLARTASCMAALLVSAVAAAQDGSAPPGPLEPTAGAPPKEARPYPHTTLNVFSEVLFSGPIRQPDNAPKLVLGAVDLFARSDLSEHVGVLGEINVSASEGVHVSRMFVSWDRYEGLTLSVGGVHSPLGFYTPAYPHGGSVFRLATRRPRIVNMEYEREILPNHLLGVMASGVAHLAASGALTYDLAVGEDGNHQRHELTGHVEKAVVASVAWRGASAVEGLELGLSAALNPLHLEHLGEEDPPPPDAPTTIVWESLAAAHAVFERYPVEALAELFLVGHGAAVADAEARILFGGFAQAGWTVGRFTPYARYEHFARADEDEAWNVMDTPVRYHSLLAGVRVVFLPTLVLKLQVEHALHDRTTYLEAQFAFGF